MNEYEAGALRELRNVQYNNKNIPPIKDNVNKNANHSTKQTKLTYIKKNILFCK